MAAIFTSIWGAVLETWFTTCGKVLGGICLVLCLGWQYTAQRDKKKVEEIEKESQSNKKKATYYCNKCQQQTESTNQVIEKIITFQHYSPSKAPSPGPPSPPRPKRGNDDIGPPTGFATWFESIRRPPSAKKSICWRPKDAT
ncbi:hypothetical protein EV127DRAFT_487632 [Xylaria flabelliformis]|nr:hypothetical protein EV127DRAFT_487632 [Xylaria flabelliformis]